MNTQQEPVRIWVGRCPDCHAARAARWDYRESGNSIPDVARDVGEMVLGGMVVALETAPVTMAAHTCGRLR